MTVPFGAWYEETDLPLQFPAGWTVQRMDPADAAEISDEQIVAALNSPIGTPRLRELARGKRSAVIAVDDLTRPTPAHRILPHLLNELHAGGLTDGDIRIVMGTAAHRPMDRTELVKKLGAAVCERFQPIMHDFMGPDVRSCGWVRGGPVYLNRHFLAGELKICLGGVIPHGETGFGGGAKMVVPGLAGRLTIAHFHGALPARSPGQLEADGGCLDRRAWSEAVARHVGVDLVVCATVNARRRLAGLYVGDLVEAHRAAARQAVAIGTTDLPTELARAADVVVVNAYPLDTDPIQMGKSLGIGKKLAAKQTVVINAASDGIFYHGMGMGSGVSYQRLLSNVPGWLVNPVGVWCWLRAMRYGLRTPMLAARTCYFALNHLSYAAFQQGHPSSATADGPAGNGGSGLDPLAFSKQFPGWGFRRKYPRGRLCRNWDDIRKTLERSARQANVLVFPCAPLQLIRVSSDQGTSTPSSITH
ncbi:MAG: DUF2088 domain-containing protein [Planctomycetes bacterium]|nr:DUF2088 domain-containing protein [Planctomycetota bacterium]